MTFREDIEDLSITFKTGKKKAIEEGINMYEETKENLRQDNMLTEDTIEFVSRLFGWLCGSYEFTKEEMKKLNMKNIAYYNEDNDKTVVFIGSNPEEEYPNEVGMEMIKMIYDDEVMYGIRDDRIVFWLPEQDKTINRKGLICN